MEPSSALEKPAREKFTAVTVGLAGATACSVGVIQAVMSIASQINRLQVDVKGWEFIALNGRELKD